MGKYLKLINIILILIMFPAWGNIDEAQKIFEQDYEHSDANTDTIKNKLQGINIQSNDAVDYVKSNKKQKNDQINLEHFLPKNPEAINPNSYLSSEEKPEEYNPAEMGEALTHFSAMKSISSPMKDGLGGIGQSSNPSVLSGKCQRCSIKGSSFIHDCCNLNGIAKGLLGGCNQDEKDLANAAIKDKRCHLIEEKYCAHRKLRVCTERKSAYCCYGSQMAKVIQEIAHQQLNISWGDGKNPICGSLTADQLSKLDFNTPFARAKLSELVTEYQTTGAQNANKIKSKVGDLQNKLNNQFKHPVNKARK